MEGAARCEGDCSNLAELPPLTLQLGGGFSARIPPEAYVMKVKLTDEEAKQLQDHGKGDDDDEDSKDLDRPGVDREPRGSILQRYFIDSRSTTQFSDGRGHVDPHVLVGRRHHRHIRSTPPLWRPPSPAPHTWRRRVWDAGRCGIQVLIRIRQFRFALVRLLLSLCRCQCLRVRALRTWLRWHLGHLDARRTTAQLVNVASTNHSAVCWSALLVRSSASTDRHHSALHVVVCAVAPEAVAFSCRGFSDVGVRGRSPWLESKGPAGVPGLTAQRSVVAASLQKKRRPLRPAGDPGPHHTAAQRPAAGRPPMTASAAPSVIQAAHQGHPPCLVRAPATCDPAGAPGPRHAVAQGQVAARPPVRSPCRRHLHEGSPGR